MSAHTPGPWEIQTLGWDGQFIYGKDDRAKGRRFIADVDLSYDGAEANGRLIAAAPDLLEALKCLLALHDSRVDTAEAWDKSMEEARAAIAKAKGEQ